MKSNAKLFTTGLAVAMGLGLSACAGVGTATRSGTEVRGISQVRAESPRLIAVGPVRLLHVDVHGGRAVNLYTAARHDGTDADCRVAEGAKTSPLHQDRRTPVDVDIPDGQVVCLIAADPASGFPRAGIEVAWHARREGGMPAGTLAFDKD
jgi:hypothetical protein